MTREVVRVIPSIPKVESSSAFGADSLCIGHIDWLGVDTPEVTSDGRTAPTVRTRSDRRRRIAEIQGSRIGDMARWLEPRSAPVRIFAQVVLLCLGAGVVYLVVTWLGSDLVAASP